MLPVSSYFVTGTHRQQAKNSLKTETSPWRGTHNWGALNLFSLFVQEAEGHASEMNSMNSMEHSCPGHPVHIDMCLDCKHTFQAVLLHPSHMTVYLAVNRMQPHLANSSGHYENYFGVAQLQ